MGSQVVMEFDNALFLVDKPIIAYGLKYGPLRYVGLASLPILGIVKLDKVKGQPTPQPQGSKSPPPQGNRV